jgi:hypothetical protein
MVSLHISQIFSNFKSFLPTKSPPQEQSKTNKIEIELQEILPPPQSPCGFIVEFQKAFPLSSKHDATINSEINHRTFENGCTYIGELKDNKLYGRGIFTWQKGDRYVGQFENNFLHGYGTLSWVEGEKYTGDFHYNSRHGQGCIIKEDGNVSIGYWEFDVLQFSSKTKIPSVYLEEFKKAFSLTARDLLIEYKITFKTLSSGKKYIGEAKGDKLCGRGIMIWSWSKGERYVGQFEDNCLHGFGTMTWQDGSQYTGDFYKDELHGVGCLTRKDGTVLRGNWIMNVFQN